MQDDSNRQGIFNKHRSNEAKMFDAIYKYVVDAYAPGDMLLDTPFHDALVDHAIDTFASLKAIPSVETIHALYDQVARPSKLRSVFAGIWLDGSIKTWGLADLVPKLPAEFIVKLATTAVVEKNMPLHDRSRVDESYRCGYHDRNMWRNDCPWSEFADKD